MIGRVESNIVMKVLSMNVECFRGEEKNDSLCEAYILKEGDTEMKSLWKKRIYCVDTK